MQENLPYPSFPKRGNAKNLPRFEWLTRIAVSPKSSVLRQNSWVKINFQREGLYLMPSVLIMRRKYFSCRPSALAAAARLPFVCANACATNDRRVDSIASR